MKKRKTKSSSSSTKKLADYSYLPPELLSEVLARVPVKPLMKFRCVSKTWCSLIDSSDFISMHRKLYNNFDDTPQLLAVERSSHKGPVITVRRSDTFRTISSIGTILNSGSILQTCNGLTLLQSRDKNYARVLRLWNPCIRKCLILPKSPLHDDPFRFYSVHYVLGFAPSSNDYKVLAFRLRSRFSNLKVAVYSLNDHCWKVIANPTGVEDGVVSCSMNGGNYVFSGSSVYWVGRYVNTDKAVVLCFDFDVEEFKSVRLPAIVKEFKAWFIFPLSGSIAVFIMLTENILIYKDGGEDGWRLWFSSELCSDAYKLLPCDDPPFSNGLYVEKSNTFLMVIRWGGGTKKY